jgi:hypothetical protein
MAAFVRLFRAEELNRIARAADERIANHNRTWSIDSSRVKNERLGVASEWAVSEWLGVPEDPVFESHGAGGDRGVDVKLPDGRAVKVKATVHLAGRLIIPTYEQFLTGFAVLCIRTSPGEVRAAGYATPIDWLLRSYVKDLRRGVGPQSVLDQTHLRPFERLVAKVKSHGSHA